MTIENDFLPFAVATNANVVPQATYVGNTSITQGGFVAGIAPSNLMNKVWRQSSIMAAVLAQFIVDNSGQPAIDDGTTATLEANLVTAIRSATKTGVILNDTGAVNAYAAANVPPLVAGTWINGVVQQVKVANTNTGASTYSPDGLPTVPIYGLGLQPLQQGEMFAGGTAILMKQTIAGVNSGNPIAVLYECAGGAQQTAPATQPLHAMQLGQATGRLIGVRTFTASTTYTPTAGTTRILVKVQGGGGGGGGTASGSNVSVAGGGGAGAYVEGFLTSGFSGATITIGAAGTGGPGGGGTGGTGGTTVFGTLSAAGGFGGQGGPNAAPPYNTLGGAGGNSASGGYLNQFGASANPCSATGISSFVSGAGANSQFGAGGAALGTTTLNGNGAQGFGAGGGGAASGSGAAAQAGGPGGAGTVIVFEYA